MAGPKAADRDRRRLLGAGLALLLGGIAQVLPSLARAADLVVFAAASMKNALDQADAAWTASTGNKVVASYAASSALAKQIEQGAPADIFLSADRDWMDYLAEAGQIRPETRADLLGNAIVLVGAPGAAAIPIVPGFPLAEKLGDGRLAMADVQAVPAGKYGKAALEKLGVWSSVEGRVAQAENVRVALALVARGEAPLGIVYRTDAAVEPGVAVVGTFPADTHPPIVYPIAVTTASTHPDAAAYVAWLRTPAAAAIFRKYGFTLPD